MVALREESEPFMYINTSHPSNSPIVIRAARDGDRQGLRRLAERDSSRVPEGELFVAEVDGEIRAAIAIASGAVIADPFHRTVHLLGMLTLHASRVRSARGPGRLARVRAALRARRHRDLAPKPADTLGALGARRA